MNIYYICIPIIMTDEKIEKLEGTFEITKPQGPNGPKRSRPVDPKTLSMAKRTMKVAKKFADAEFDPERPVSEVFKTSKGNCVLLGLRCDCESPCLECRVGCESRAELRFMIDVYLGATVQ